MRIHAIYGTLIITGCATIISVPIGIMAAIYLQEYGTGRLKRALTFFVDVMTGIPSIVAGLFAFALFSFFYGPGIRLGIMGSVALSVLMIPIVVRSTEEMLRIVPELAARGLLRARRAEVADDREGRAADGAGGIVTGVVLAIARIIGETAPLLITTGVVASVNTNPFDGRMHEPRGLRLQLLQVPRRAARAVDRPRLDRRARPDPDRDGAQRHRAPHLPPLRHGDP